MRHVLLVSGDHLSGKSTLADELAKHRFEVISVDDVYVEWVKAHCSSLYFDYLGKYIFHHYHYILVGDYTQDVFGGRDLGAEWHAHLLRLIIERSQKHDRLVVEGYLLFDCKDDYEAELTKQSMQVAQIHAENRHYFSNSRQLTIGDIVSLGTT